MAKSKDRPSREGKKPKKEKPKANATAGLPRATTPPQRPGKA